MNGILACRLLKLSPGVVSSPVMDSLLVLKPQGHLFDVILFVSGAVGILSIVDVKSGYSVLYPSVLPSTEIDDM